MHSANSSQRKIFPEDNNMSYPNANDHPAWDSPQQAYNNTDLEKGENTHMHPVGRRPSSAGSARSASSRGSAATYQSSNFEHPENAVEIDPKHKRAVKVFGKVGFVAKAIIVSINSCTRTAESPLTFSSWIAFVCVHTVWCSWWTIDTSRRRRTRRFFSSGCFRCNGRQCCGHPHPCRACNIFSVLHHLEIVSRYCL